MKWILFFFLAACSVQVSAKTEAEKAKEQNLENCVSRTEAVLKMGDAYTEKTGAITARCKTVVYEMSEYGYFYFDRCITSKKDVVIGASQTVKLKILNECVSKASADIMEANKQKQQNNTIVDPVSWADCQEKMKQSGFNLDAVARYIKELSREEDKLAKCGDYLDCIQQALAKGKPRIPAVDSCTQLEPGQQGGPTNRVNRQGSGGNRAPAQ